MSIFLVFGAGCPFCLMYKNILNAASKFAWAGQLRVQPLTRQLG